MGPDIGAPKHPRAGPCTSRIKWGRAVGLERTVCGGCGFDIFRLSAGKAVGLVIFLRISAGKEFELVIFFSENLYFSVPSFRLVIALFFLHFSFIATPWGKIKKIKISTLSFFDFPWPPGPRKCVLSKTMIFFLIYIFFLAQYGWASGNGFL